MKVKFQLSDLANSIGGTSFGPDLLIDGVSIDSRHIEPGALFVPIVAERDGHSFVEGALSSGAGAYLTSRGQLGGSGIEVASTSDALIAIGVEARKRLSPPVVGITGSVGKTSAKDLLTAACSAGARTHSNLASFNNELGLPLTLANAAPDTEVTIVEMGSRGIGHIAELCSIAQPTIGIITRVVMAHSELFETIENVAKAKGELIEALPSSGTAVLNSGDEWVARMAGISSAPVMSYGGTSSDVVATDVVLDALLRPSFTVETAYGRCEVRLELSGRHMVDNALAAIAGGLAAGLELETLAEGLSKARSAAGRMEMSRSPGGTLIINDAYNANPTSLRAGLASLAAIEAERKVAMVGVMAELGQEGANEHQAIANEAVELGIEVIAIASPDYGENATHVRDIPAALEALGQIGPGDAVLVKASLSAGLQRLAAVLLA